MPFENPSIRLYYKAKKRILIVLFKRNLNRLQDMWGVYSFRLWTSLTKAHKKCLKPKNSHKAKKFIFAENRKTFF